MEISNRSVFDICRFKCRGELGKQCHVCLASSRKGETRLIRTFYVKYKSLALINKCTYELTSGLLEMQLISSIILIPKKEPSMCLKNKNNIFRY